MYKGVCFHKLMKKWYARIQIEGLRKHLGYFDSEKEAAAAYNASATELFKNFARLNEIVD